MNGFKNKIQTGKVVFILVPNCDSSTLETWTPERSSENYLLKIVFR